MMPMTTKERKIEEHAGSRCMTRSQEARMKERENWQASAKERKMDLTEYGQL